MEEPMSSRRSVSLPENICHAAEQKFSHQFGDLAELLTSVLNHLLRDDALLLDGCEQKIIEERLKGLGYI
jgi:hypothetical protein